MFISNQSSLFLLLIVQVSEGANLSTVWVFILCFEFVIEFTQVIAVKLEENMSLLFVSKDTLLRGGNVPPELTHCITQAEYNSLSMTAQLCDSESKNLALLFECGACVLFCLFCAFFAHECIADALFESTMQP